MSEDSSQHEIQDREQALEALESFDPGQTKRALRFLVDSGDVHALPRILPLTQHASAALRFVAKRAVQELRALGTQPARGPAPPPTSIAPGPESSEPPPPQALPRAVGAGDELLGMDPRLEKLLERPPRRLRGRRPRPGGVPMRWFDLEL